MFEQALGSVFANAAIPQKVMLALLAGALPLILIAATLASRKTAQRRRWRHIVSGLGVAGPALGLLVGAMGGFHIGQTILRLPFDATAKQLAPGILEVATLIGLGALVGLVAAGAHLALGWTGGREAEPSGQPRGGPL